MLRADSSDLRQACGVEQEDWAAIVRQRGPGIETGRHYRGSSGLYHQLFVIVDAVDGERINVAAGRAEHDQSTVLYFDLAFEAEDLGERNFGDAAAADRCDAGAAELLERH